MAAVWLTVLLVYAARRDDAWVWLFYGIALAISLLLDVYLALSFLAHVVFICVFRRTRKVLISFAITSVLAVCALAPFVVLAAGQLRRIRVGSHRLGAGRSKMWRFNNNSERSPPVCASVGGGSSRRYCVVALHICATGRDKIGNC